MGFAQHLIRSGIRQGVTVQQLYRHSKITSPAAGLDEAAITDPSLADFRQQQRQHQEQHANHFPPSPAEYTWEDLRNPSFITKLLSDCVLDQYLYPWYKWTDISELAQRIATSGALAQVAEAWQLPPSLAADLVTMALFDVTMLLDDERSMLKESERRRHTLRHLVRLVAEATTRLSSSGLQLHWCNSPKHALVSDATEALNFVDLSALGATHTSVGVAFKQKMLEPDFYTKLRTQTLRKPILVIVIVSERPKGYDLDKFCRNARRAKERALETKYGADAISIQLTTLGDEQPSAAFLHDLSADAAARDIFAVCFDRRIESQQLREYLGADLSPELWALKIIMTAIKEAYENFGWIKLSKHGAASKLRRRNHNEWEATKFQRQSSQFKQAREAALQAYLSSHPAGGSSLILQPIPPYAFAQQQQPPSYLQPSTTSTFAATGSSLGPPGLGAVSVWRRDSGQGDAASITDEALPAYSRR
ncbi:hypothetical protein V8E36_002963 [Tilletia maclaganii]